MKLLPALAVSAVLLLATALPRPADAQQIKPLLRPLSGDVRTLRKDARIDDRLDARTMIREDTDMQIGSDLLSSGIVAAPAAPSTDETVRAARAERLLDDEARVKAAAAIDD